MQTTFITTTSYGSWLPGDVRGYVQRGEILPPAPRLRNASEQLLQSQPIQFTASDQSCLLQGICVAAEEFEYALLDLSIEAWHLHWIINHADPIKKMVGRLKNRMRQSLNRGKIWTKGYHFRVLKSEAELLNTRNYIAVHEGVRMINGMLINA